MRKIIDRLMVILFIIVLIFTGNELLKTFKDQKAASDDYAVVEQHREIIEKGNDEEKEFELKINWKELKKINENCIAWIYIPGTPIDYPIIQSTDNQYALCHLINGSWHYKGCIYISERCNGFDNPNTLIYGHNTLDGTMFASINKYRDQEFYEDHKKVYIATPEEGTKEYKIFTAYTTIDANDTYDLLITPEHLEKYWKQSVIKTDTKLEEVLEKGKIITISTCRPFDGNDLTRAIIQLIEK